MAPARQPGSTSDDVDPFADCYKINYGEVERIIDHVEQLWLNKDFEAVGFYNLGGDRMTLIRVLECARISGFFDDELWEAIEANAPTEAKPIAHQFDLRDISLP